MELSADLRQHLLVFQRNEITEHHIYKRLAKTIKSPENREILEKIAEDELKHYTLWKAYMHQEVKPNRFGLWFYYLILENYNICLTLALAAAVLIIAFFNYYISVAKDEPFRERFFEIAALSLGVASFSFILGYFIRTALGVEI